MNMKKLVLSALAPLLLAGCYKDYTLDYDYTAAYIAYQYDLRTFVIGEEGKFDFTVALAGTARNNEDRKVEVEAGTSCFQRTSHSTPRRSASQVSTRLTA